MRPLNWLQRRPKQRGKPRPRSRGGLRARLRSRWVRTGLTGFVVCSLIGSGGAYLWYGGYVTTALKATTAAVDHTALRAGLGIARIEIRGLRYSDSATVQRSLGAKMKVPLYTFDPAAARERLLAYGWIEWATVSRRFPDTIYVDIRERQPFALWQHKKKLHLIDRSGTVITSDRLGRFNSLPLVVGGGADSQAAEVIDMLSMYVGIAGRLKAAVLIGERRWNLRFDNRVEVRLPEQETLAALQRLAALQERHSILDRKLRAIDLRLPDRLIVQLLEPVPVRSKNRGKKT